MNSGRILVIEDDPPSRMMLARGLQRMGFAVEASKDALEAQARIRTAGPQSYDAVVVDLRMPRMDGMQFVDWLEGFDGNLGCMLLSAQQDEEIGDHSDHPSLLFRMQKPASFQVLGEALQKIVEFTHTHRNNTPEAASA